MSSTPAGWYPAGDVERYWDGSQWTQQTRPLGGGAPPMPPGQQPGTVVTETPPKKKHTVRNVLLVVTALFVLSVGGCMALVGGAIDAADTAIQKQAKDSAPRSVDEGARFTIGKYTVQRGWSVGSEFGSFTAEDVVVKNTSDETDTVFFTLKVLRDSRVLASISCNTAEIEPGQAQRANCFDTGSEKFSRNWNKLTVESTF